MRFLLLVKMICPQRVSAVVRYIIAVRVKESAGHFR